MSKHIKRTKPECFKLVTVFAASSGKVLLSTVSLLKWNYWTHVEKENNCTASHIEATVGRVFFDCKMKMHHNPFWCIPSAASPDSSRCPSNGVNLSAGAAQLEKLFQMFLWMWDLLFENRLSDNVERVRAQQCYQNNSWWSFWIPCHPNCTFLNT